jgi:hypothetical protein
MSSRPRVHLDLTTTAVVSVAAHAFAAFLVVGALTLAGRAPQPRDLEVRDAEALADSKPVEIELEAKPEANPADTSESRTPALAPDPTPRGTDVARVDSGNRGRGGDPTSRLQALNLADRSETFRADRSVVSRLDRSQLPRINKAMTRRAYEDFRASREPMIVTFLNLGSEGPDVQRSESRPFLGRAKAAHLDQRLAKATDSIRVVRKAAIKKARRATQAEDFQRSRRQAQRTPRRAPKTRDRSSIRPIRACLPTIRGSPPTMSMPSKKSQVSCKESFTRAPLAARRDWGKAATEGRIHQVPAQTRALGRRHRRWDPVGTAIPTHASAHGPITFDAPSRKFTRYGAMPFRRGPSRKAAKARSSSHGP